MNPHPSRNIPGQADGGLLMPRGQDTPPSATRAHPEPPTPAGQADTPAPGRQCEVARPDHRARGTAGLLVQGAESTQGAGAATMWQGKGAHTFPYADRHRARGAQGKQGRGSSPNPTPQPPTGTANPKATQPAKAREQGQAEGTATQSQEAKGTTRHTRLNTLSKGM